MQPFDQSMSKPTYPQRTTIMTTLSQPQDSYVARVLLAPCKVTPRTTGDRFGRSVRAARRDGMARLMRLGFAEADAFLSLKILMTQPG
jgi:hypothetical protein